MKYKILKILLFAILMPFSLYGGISSDFIHFPDGTQISASEGALKVPKILTTVIISENDSGSSFIVPLSVLEKTGYSIYFEVLGLADIDITDPSDGAYSIDFGGGSGIRVKSLRTGISYESDSKSIWTGSPLYPFSNNETFKITQLNEFTWEDDYHPEDLTAYFVSPQLWGDLDYRFYYYSESDDRYLRLDGSSVMSGDLDMGDHSIINLKTDSIHFSDGSRLSVKENEIILANTDASFELIKGNYQWDREFDKFELTQREIDASGGVLYLELTNFNDYDDSWFHFGIPLDEITQLYPFEKFGRLDGLIWMDPHNTTTNTTVYKLELDMDFFNPENLPFLDFEWWTGGNNNYEGFDHYMPFEYRLFYKYEDTASIEEIYLGQKDQHGSWKIKRGQNNNEIRFYKGFDLGFNFIEYRYSGFTIDYSGDPIVQPSEWFVWSWDSPNLTASLLGLQSNLEKEMFTALYVSENVQAYIVTEIGEQAFMRSAIRWLEMPDTIERINAFAFLQTEIETLHIPDSVNYIGGGAFSGNRMLKEIKLSESLEEINTSTFFDNISLEKIVIPNSVTNIARSAFGYCRSLAEVTLPENLKTIGSSAFSSIAIEHIIIPDLVEEIGDMAFSYCSRLTNVVFGSNVKTISENAFAFCNLQSLIIPESVENIEQMAFRGYKGESVKFMGANPPSIADSAFWDPAHSPMTVKVPDGSVEAYENLPVFSGHLVEAL